MMVDIGKIISLSDLEKNLESICDKVEEEKELIIFRDNKPAFVFMTIENYQNIKNDYFNNDYEIEELRDPNDESLETLLNKIGKKTFIDYYYVFKEDINPKEKLPEDFTLNSRRSRSSSARKIFKNSLEIAALNNILQSQRLDEDTLINAKTILENETKNTGTKIFDIDNEIDKDIKIGKSARTLISRFLQDGIITNEEIQLMRESDYSKKIFKLNYPVLKEFDNNLDMDQQKRDQRGYNRYYDNVIPASGKEYLLCSQWVDNLHRNAFEKWLESKLMIILINTISELKKDTEFRIPEILNEYWTYIPNRTRISLGRKFVEMVRNHEVSNVYELNGMKRKNCQVYRKD